MTPVPAGPGSVQQNIEGTSPAPHAIEAAVRRSRNSQNRVKRSPGRRNSRNQPRSQSRCRGAETARANPGARADRRDTETAGTNPGVKADRRDTKTARANPGARADRRDTKTTGTIPGARTDRRDTETARARACWRKTPGGRRGGDLRDLRSRSHEITGKALKSLHEQNTLQKCMEQP